MRIKINFSANTSIVPNNNRVVLEYLHRCLGRDNEYHDKRSEYSVSHLYGGEICKDNPKNINYPNGGYFTISSQDKDFINNFLLGLIKNPILSNGMMFSKIDHIKESFLDGWNHFCSLSPFIIKNNNGIDNYSFMTLDGEYKRIEGKWQLLNNKDYNFEDVVKNYLIKKLSKINSNIDLSDFKVKIDELDKNGIKHNKHKVKKVYVNNVLNFANQCQISIYCNKKTAELIYNLGIGQSTGAGFGTIYKTENNSIYRSKKVKLENKKEELLSELV